MILACTVEIWAAFIVGGGAGTGILAGILLIQDGYLERRQARKEQADA